jgi:hypothetical protein
VIVYVEMAMLIPRQKFVVDGQSRFEKALREHRDIEITRLIGCPDLKD